MSWSLAITMPPASGTWRRTSESRLSAASSTAGIHEPCGSSAVRRAWACMSLVSGSPRRAAISSPARVRHCHLAGVGHEQHRPHDVVGERVGVAVGEVGGRGRDAVVAGRVADERDRVDVGAERRAGQRQPAGGRVERLAHALAPRQRVAGVVDLVEDHQGLEALGADPHRERVDRDAGVGHRDADVVVGGPALARGVGRVDRDAGPRRGLGPLGLEVLGRRDDGDPVDDAAAQQVGRDGQRERRLAGAGRRDGEEVAGLAGLVVVHRRLLPGTEGGRGAPGGPVGPRGGQRRVRPPRHASGPEPSDRRRAVAGLHRLPDLLALRAHRELLRRPRRAPRPCRTGRSRGCP